MQRSGYTTTEDPFAGGATEFGLQGNRRVASAYSHKNKGNTLYMAGGIAAGMLMIMAVYYVHSSRAAAEVAKHHEHTQDVLHRHRMDEHVSDREHAEMLAKHGLHETDEDLRMHALEFFEQDTNKDAFHAGPDATKAEIESMDKNNDQAVSWREYLEGFHNERLMDELFHYYYGEIYGKKIPNHYHSERHPDAVVDHHELHENDKEITEDHPDFKHPHEQPGVHYDIPTAEEKAIEEGLKKIEADHQAMLAKKKKLERL